MKPHPTDREKPPRHDKPTASATLQKLDELLDEALEGTFPASDPISLNQPSRARRAKLRQ
jgi:hypothetical protein